MLKIFGKLDSFVEMVTSKALITCVLAMLLLSVASILFLRAFFFVGEESLFFGLILSLGI